MAPPPPRAARLRRFLFTALALAGVSPSTGKETAPEAEAGTFLGGQLPLRVLSVLPAPFEQADTKKGSEPPAVELAGRTALTVVFSRAVIALGADWPDKGDDGDLPEELVPFRLEACKGQPAFAVPGRMRWSTTAIARFDPGVDWPTDLCFRLMPNMALRSYDGLALGTGGGPSSGWRFTTRPMGMFLSFVRSDKAQNLTDGRWTSDTFGKSGDEVHECPPDAIVYLSFSSDLDHDAAFKALQHANAKILPSSEPDAYEKCGRRCLAVRPRGLEAGKNYKFVFPKGGKYGRIAGLAGRERHVSLTGLVPFAFPFLFETPPAQPWMNRKLRYRRHLLYLRHGLEATDDPAAQLTALKAAMSLSSSTGELLSFELSRKDNATLQLECNALEPEKRYKLQVLESLGVKDGFGQPLQRCSMEYDSAGWPDAFVQAEESPAYFRSSPGDWQVLARGDGNHWCEYPPKPPPVVLPVPPVPVPTLPVPQLPKLPATPSLPRMPEPPKPVSVPSMPPLPTIPSLPAIEPLPDAPGLHDGPTRRLWEQRKCEPKPFELRAWPVSARNFPAALAQRYNQRMSFLEDGGLKVTAPKTNELKALVLEGDELLLGGSSNTSGGPSGLFLRELQRYASSSRKGFVSVAPFGVSFVATAADELLVWATDFKKGRAVEGAEITVYCIAKTYDAQLKDIAKVAMGKTGEDGTAALSPESGHSWSAFDGRCPQLMAVVEAPDGALALSEAVPVPWTGGTEPTTRAELVTDRSIYRPGDTVYVKGYIRTLNADGTALSLPEKAAASFAFEVRWKSGPGSGSTAKHRVEADLKAKFGTVAVNLSVPESEDEVTYGNIEISLVRTSLEKPQEKTTVPATTSITVADPRPPTVTLNLTADNRVVLPGPAAAVDIELHTATYSGIGVEGAEVELTWTLKRADHNLFSPGGNDGGAEVVGMASLPAVGLPLVQQPGHWRPLAFAGSHEDGARAPSGKLTVVTGSGGRGRERLALADLLEACCEDGGGAAPCAEGDELEISARWVGPTREVVRAELQGGPLRVARSPSVLALTPTRPVDANEGTPLPGTTFGVYVDLRNGEGESVEGAEVTLSLHEWDGSAPIREVPTAHVLPDASSADIRKAALQSGLLPVSSWGDQVGDACKATADGGKKAQCTSALTLPAPKKYVVLARARDADDVELISAFAVGRTPKEWKKRPLASLDAAVTVRPDKQSYAVGDTATLSLMSPFQDATALVIWGNGKGRRSMQQRLEGEPGEEHSLSVKLGDECSFGCRALVLLAAPDQPQDDVLPVKVPASPLLDTALPRAVAKTVRLEVPDTGRALAEGAVSVVVTEAGATAAAEVLRPGDSAEVRVSVPRQEAGAEVCIFVVDKAMLDVGEPAHPHPEVALDKRFELKRGDEFLTDDTREALASAEGYRRTAATAVRRAALDPWAYDRDWPLRPNVFSDPAPVEQSDEDYFADKTDEATHFPSPLGWMGIPEQDDIVLGANHLMRARAAPLALAAMGEAAEFEADEADEVPAPTTPPLKKHSEHGGTKSRGGGAALDKAAFTRSQFETTPLFIASAVVGDDGMATVPFKLPDNIATFEVRAYVVDGAGAHRFARAKTSVISRRDVSLVPSVPRIVRPGDRFECGVSVTGHVPQKAGGVGLPEGGITLRARVLDENATVALRKHDMVAFKASQGDGGLKRNLSGSASGPQEVLFPFEAPSVERGGGLGLATLRFTANLSSGEAADGLETKLAVKAPQAPVFVATSFAISASNGSEAEAAEGLDLPEAMPGSGQLALTVGVGHLPAVVADAASIIGRKMNNGQVLAAALAPAAALGLYFAPGTSAAAGVAATAGLDKVAATFGAALDRLPAYTDHSMPQLGLVWRPDEGERWPGYEPHADVGLNAFGLIIARLVSESAARAPRSKAAGGGAWASLSLAVPGALTSQWRRALEHELGRQVTDLHFKSHPPCRSDCYRSWADLAQVRAALGFQWQARSNILREEMDLGRLFTKEGLNSLGPQGLAHAVLAYSLHAPLKRLPAGASKRLNMVYRRLASLLRVQGRTAYVAASPESQHSAGLEANAVVLLALAHAGGKALAHHFADNAGASLAAKLAAYVADGAGAGSSVRFGGGDWMSVRGAAYATAALAAYDLACGSTRPHLQLNASSGEVDVLSYRATGPGTPPATAALPWERLARPPKPLRFEASGRGQVSVMAALTFVPASVPTDGAVYRGLFVEKVVRRMDPATGKPRGEALTVVNLGESVVVTIQVTTPDDLARVMLEDLSAGGLEPVDPKVAGDQAGSSSSGSCGGDRYGWSWWCIPSFGARETYADRVTWSSRESLQAGTHTVSYQAVAATRGVFTLPPAHAYVEDQPEVLGISQAGTIVVVGSGCAVAGGAGSSGGQGDEDSPDSILQRLGVEPRKEMVPKDCPGGCPNGGVCQLATGKCGCYHGLTFLDGDCPAPAAEDAVRLFRGRAALAGPPGGLRGAAVLSACGTLAVLLSAVALARRHKSGSLGTCASVREASYVELTSTDQ